MRVTNQMISNNSLRNLQVSTRRQDELTLQLTTGQKIQRASEDPVIAVRALKLRNTVSQLKQYKEKNIKDADSWIELTENSITNISNYLEYMSGYCTQGASDQFNNDDRSAVAETIRAYKDMIFSEGDTTYAGRYVFSGYKTDTSLVFSDADANTFSYEITEEFDHTALDVKKSTYNAVNPADVDDYLSGADTYGTNKYPKQVETYRLRLSYGNTTPTPLPTIKYLDAGGNEVTMAVTSVKVATQAEDYYKDLDDDEVRYLPETGEILFGKNQYDLIQNTDKITVDYSKDEFKKYDLRPEHYFNCTQTNKATGETVDFTVETGDQSIEYEVNFNQMIRVNTLGRDLITPDMGRAIEELADKVNEVGDAEKRLAELNDMLANPKYANDPAAIEQLNYMITDASNEAKMKQAEMQQLFNKHIGIFRDFQTTVTALQSDSGARAKKLDMIATRVADQYVNFTELMSTNEEVEYEDAAIDYSNTSIVYNAALQVTSNVLQKSLLDFL